MRSLVVILALAVSPAVLTVCRLTCSVPAGGHQHAAEVSCHKNSQVSDGPALNGEDLCRHADDDVLLANASQAFQLWVVSVQLSSPVVVIERPINSLSTTAFSSASPPPLLLPLRI